MTSKESIPVSIPYLSGGILFNLMVEATKIKKSARSRTSGYKDECSDSNLMKALLKVITGEDVSQYDKSVKTSTSNYKRCTTYKSSYTPQGDEVSIKAFHNRVMSNDFHIYQQMKNLTDYFLAERKMQWLIKAILETIIKDTSISSDAEFSINSQTKLKKEQLQTVTHINLEFFLVSIWDYILINKTNNKLGRLTFEAWYKQSCTNSKWKFINENIGTTITQNIEITRFETPVYNEEKATECSKTPDMKEDSEIFNPETDIPVVEADDISNEEKQAPKQITQTINNPKIVNQYADKIYNIEHVDHLD
ncbi:hypothetical protein C3L56_00550 [Veillonellaceae bacterium M2-4]|nr:hypothetical protein [Veillonellaceae bacterium M2-4]